MNELQILRDLQFSASETMSGKATPSVSTKGNTATASATATSASGREGR
jgi:hypothetical protein